jgi:hypothetical protein
MPIDGSGRPLRWVTRSSSGDGSPKKVNGGLNDSSEHALDGWLHVERLRYVA